MAGLFFSFFFFVIRACRVSCTQTTSIYKTVVDGTSVLRVRVVAVMLIKSTADDLKKLGRICSALDLF